MLRSVDDNNSRYVQGGTTTTFNNRTGWWERRYISESPDDIYVIITSRTDQRPYLVASDVYNNEALEWLVLQYNNILDIATEFTTGKQIKLPTLLRVQMEIMTQPLGGMSDVQS